jgi:23S rRNA (cytosine1962-C5)-methyltransferase
VDSSEAALQYLEHNLQRNRLPVDRARLLRGDAFNALADLAREGRQFEAVSLDPPAFIKRKRDHAAGRRAYEKLNALGLDLLAPGGFLMTCSCSQHLQRQELLNILARAASKKGREMRIIRFCHQGPDHPVLPAMPETEYLKGVVAQVL